MGDFGGVDLYFHVSIAGMHGLLKVPVSGIIGSVLDLYLALFQIVAHLFSDGCFLWGILFPCHNKRTCKVFALSSPLLYHGAVGCIRSVKDCPTAYRLRLVP